MAAPVRVSVPLLTDRAAPVPVPLIDDRPVEVVMPLTVPVTDDPLSAVVPLKIPAMVALLKVPPPVPFTVSGEASVPPVKSVAPVTPSGPVPLTVPLLFVSDAIVSAALIVKVPALVTAAVSERLPVSIRVAPPAMLTGLLVELPLKVKTPLVTLSEPPPTVPLIATAPVLVVLPKRLPDTVPPLSVAPPVAVKAALPARVPVGPF